MTKVWKIDALASNSMKSGNPYSGIHPILVAPCLDTSAVNPTMNQGGAILVRIREEQCVLVKK